MLHLRDEADVKCPASETNSGNKCQPLKQPCLFNIVKDPCEQRNLANVYAMKSFLGLVYCVFDFAATRKF